MALEERNGSEVSMNGHHHDDSNSRRRSAPLDDGGPQGQHTSFKRQRTALACNSCRTRKSRCDGTRPKCTMCIEMGLECIYQQPAATSSKGQPTGFEGRLNSIEETLRLLVDENRRLQQTQAHPITPASQSSQNTLQVGLEAQPDDVDAATSSRDGTQAPAPAEDTVDGMGAITFADEQESGFFGPSSNIAFIGQISHAMIKVVGADVTRPAKDPRFDGTIMSLSRPASPIGTLPNTSIASAASLDVYTLPPEAEMLHLIRLFFSDTGMLFPYIHEGALLDTFAVAKRNNFRSVRRSWLCLLNMILAFAVCVSARPDLPVERSAAEADVYFRRAQALSGKMAFKSANLEIVQYLLLMTQYLQGTQRSAQTWNLHGLTVKAALQLGLHSNGATSKFTPLENEIRKRTWYGCIVLDRTLSMTFGRPPAIPSEFIQLDLPVNMGLDVFSQIGGKTLPPEVPQAPSTVCLFIATIKLYRVLGDTISNLFGQNLGCAKPLSISEMLEQVIKLERLLSDWKRDLPPELRIKPWDSSFKESEQTFIFDRLSIIITLRYLNIRVLLHRQVLAEFLDQVHNRNNNVEEDNFLHQFGQSSLQVCVDSASEIISIIHKVGKRPYLLGAWWFWTYYTFNAALVVFAGLLIKVNAAPGSTDQSKDELKRSLDLAVETLQSLGGGVRLVERCRKYLQTLVKVAASLTSPNGAGAPGITAPLGNSSETRSVSFIGKSSSDETDLSPLGMDLGEFLTEENLDFLTSFLPNGDSQLNFDFPIQGY